MGQQHIHENGDRDRGGRRRRPEGAAISGPRVGGFLRDLKSDKGFGFITGDDGEDRFFHKAGMVDASKPFHLLDQGDRCTFVASRGEKGPRAEAVEFASE